MTNKNIEKAFTNSFVNGLTKIADGLIQVLSLGYLYSSFNMTYVEAKVRRKMRRGKR